jgi:NAD(P)-dependent dehydrogenase (short-subunit alcohol dehydrogenase family)
LKEVRLTDIPKLKVNLLHLMYTVNAFLPLIRNGHAKKLIYISSGNGDVDVIRTTELPVQLGYAVSKASGNIIMAKYAAELKSEGIVTLSLSPGWVATDACMNHS